LQEKEIKTMRSNMVLVFFLILLVVTNCTLFDNDDNKIVYISPRDLKQYHNYECEILDEIKKEDKDKIISLTKGEAKERNLKSCVICKP
jgi:hypothetical protein